MRGLPVPLCAIALISSAAGAQGADSYLPRTGVKCASPSVAQGQLEQGGFAGRNTFTIFNTLGLQISRLVSVGCHADDGKKEPVEAAQPLTSGSTSLTGGNLCGDGDTITGVFHRLDPQRATLQLAQVVFRHGARTPLSRRADLWRGTMWDVCGEAYQPAAMRLISTTGVENPVSKHDLRQRSVVLDGGCRKGELTLKGQSQALELGRWLRTRYVAETGFLPDGYRAGVVEARTTNFSRTVGTLRGVLTGLYPDLTSQAQQQGQEQGQDVGARSGSSQQHGDMENGQSSWQVPEVTTSGDLDEILYADTRACPHLGSFQTMAREVGRAAIRSDPDYAWAREELLRLLVMDASAFDSDRWIFTDVHDVLTSLEAHGKPLPPGFAEQPRLRAVINRLATKEFGAEVAPSVRDSHGRTILRLSMGRLLHILVGNMHQAAETAVAKGSSAEDLADGRVGGTSPRMYLYSGHDSTIMPLLAALGVDVSEWPPYLSNLVLELWQLPPRADGSAPRHVVRVLFNQQELALPHCPPGYQPSLQTFAREVVGPFLLSAQHYQELCSVEVQHDSSMPQPKAKSASISGATA